MCSFYHHLDHHACYVCAQATLLIVPTYIRSKKILILICTCICTCIVNINQPYLLGSHRICVSMAKSTWYHIAAHALIGFHVCQYDGTFIHYLLSYSKFYHIYIKMDGGKVFYWEKLGTVAILACAVAMKSATYSQRRLTVIILFRVAITKWKIHINFIKFINILPRQNFTPYGITISISANLQNAQAPMKI